MPTQKVKREIIVASPDTCEGGDTDSKLCMAKLFSKDLREINFLSN